VCDSWYCNTLQHTATHCNTLQHTDKSESVWSRAFYRSCRRLGCRDLYRRSMYLFLCRSLFTVIGVTFYWSCRRLVCRDFNRRSMYLFICKSLFIGIQVSFHFHKCCMLNRCCRLGLIERNPPPGGFPTYYVPSSRTVSKRIPLEAPGTNSSRGVLLHTVLDEGT